MEETIHFNENLQRSSKFEKGIKSLKENTICQVFRYGQTYKNRRRGRE